MKKIKGFTILEMLISVSLLAIILAVGGTYLATGNPQKQLAKQMNLMVNHLRGLQVKAQTGQMTNGEKPQMYGLYYEDSLGIPKKYFLFAEFGEDCLFNDNDQIIETVFFEPNVDFAKSDQPFGLCYPVAAKVFSVCLNEKNSFSCQEKNSKVLTISDKKNELNESVKIDLFTGAITEYH